MDSLLLLSLALLALISLLAYRIYFHPLAHIPGPPLAKVTYLYEWYYDLYQNGQFSFQLKALHRRYGTNPTLHLPGADLMYCLPSRPCHSHQPR